MKWLGLLILFAAAARAPAQEPSNAASAEEPAIAAAKANRSKIRTPPAMISAGIDGMKGAVEAQRALGHHGEVVVVGVLGIDGRFRDARIETSSRSNGLDGLALEAARQSILSPAKDESGAPIPVWLTMPFSFDNRAFREGGGVNSYRCSEFTRDLSWWRSAWPERGWSEHKFYKLMLGFGIAGIISTARGNQELIRRSLADFEARWGKAIDTCSARPNALVADIFGPEGKRARSLSKVREGRR